MAKARNARGASPGEPSTLAEVHRVARERSWGSGSLYTFGYRELAELVSADPWSVAEAITRGQLEPLSLLELAAATKHGLPWLIELQATDSPRRNWLRRTRPEHVTEVLRAKVQSLPRRYGLGDLWAIGHADIAAQLDREIRVVWDDQRMGALSITDIASVVSYVGQHAPPAARKHLLLGD